IETLHAAREAKLAPLSEAWRIECVLLAHLEKIWRTPDRGIWEVRSEPRAFTHSRLMCWVAFDRAIESARRFRLEGPIEQWLETRDLIHKDICENGFNTERNTFVQYYGGEALDASLLLMPQV